MSELPNDSTSKLPTVAENIAKEQTAAAATYVSATHAVLFEPQDERCSVCNEPIATDDTEDDPYVPGRGLLVWTRGDERRYEEPHLCPSCASAIGVTALQRWEIEEDEG